MNERLSCVRFAEFEVEAVDIDEARELFKSGKGEMVESGLGRERGYRLG